jgi:glycosyltransferase involved in cell wall biosynthesis
MLSWRYVDHPDSGGAEVVTHEVLRRLARDHEVTCFTAAYPGSEPEGEIDGVRLVRRGRQWSVHAQAWRWLRGRRDGFDRVIDQINTIPFLTPLYVPRNRRHMYIHQLAREYWFRETHGPFKLVAPFGYLAEPGYLRLYRRTPVVTVSPSTKADLRALGVRDVTVTPQALPFSPLPEPEAKDGPLRVIVLGRLTPAKFVEEALDAFAAVQRRVPDARLDLVGEGDPAYRARLEARLAETGTHGVVFHGRVDGGRKLELLRAAHVHLFSSHREGWGLTVTEAAAMGTPTVGYDAPGVRDSVAEPELLAPIGDTDALAERITSLHADRPRYERLRRAAWERTLPLSYDATAAAFAAAISVDWEPAAGTAGSAR